MLISPFPSGQQMRLMNNCAAVVLLLLPLLPVLVVDFRVVVEAFDGVVVNERSGKRVGGFEWNGKNKHGEPSILVEYNIGARKEGYSLRRSKARGWYIFPGDPSDAAAELETGIKNILTLRIDGKLRLLSSVRGAGNKKKVKKGDYSRPPQEVGHYWWWWATKNFGEPVKDVKATFDGDFNAQNGSYSTEVDPADGGEFCISHDHQHEFIFMQAHHHQADWEHWWDLVLHPQLSPEAKEKFVYDGIVVEREGLVDPLWVKKGKFEWAGRVHEEEGGEKQDAGAVARQPKHKVQVTYPGDPIPQFFTVGKGELGSFHYLVPYGRAPEEVKSESEFDYKKFGYRIKANGLVRTLRKLRGSEDEMGDGHHNGDDGRVVGDYRWLDPDHVLANFDAEVMREQQGGDGGGEHLRLPILEHDYFVSSDILPKQRGGWFIEVQPRGSPPDKVVILQLHPELPAGLLEQGL